MHVKINVRKTNNNRGHYVGLAALDNITCALSVFSNNFELFFVNMAQNRGKLVQDFVERAQREDRRLVLITVSIC